MSPLSSSYRLYLRRAASWRGDRAGHDGAALLAPAAALVAKSASVRSSFASFTPHRFAARFVKYGPALQVPHPALLRRGRTAPVDLARRGQGPGASTTDEPPARREANSSGGAVSLPNSDREPSLPGKSARALIV